MFKAIWKQILLILIISILFIGNIIFVYYIYQKSFWSVDNSIIRGFKNIAFNKNEFLYGSLIAIFISLIGFLSIFITKSNKEKILIVILSSFIFISIFLTGYVFLYLSPLVFWLTFWISFLLTLSLLLIYAVQIKRKLIFKF